MNKFDRTHSPVALYNFTSRSLEDFSGNGFDLGGTANFREVAPQRFELAPGSDPQRGGFDAALALTGDCTVEVTGRFYATPASSIFASFTVSGESLPTNTLWQLGASSASQLRWIQERTASATDDTHLAGNAPELLPAPGCEFHAVAVRQGGVVTCYLNGRQWGAPSPAFAAPTGGTSAFLRVMFGGTTFGLQGLKIIPSALSPTEVEAEYFRVMGAGAPAPSPLARSWLGALTDTSATIVQRLVPETTVRTDLSGLDPDTEYSEAGVTFRTLPAAGAPCDFTIAFGGDAVLGSTHPVFQRIVEQNPRMFIHLGDLHYSNIATNSPALFHAAFDGVLASPTQHRLYRTIPTAYVWDDHDFGGNNCDGTSASKPAAAAVYRDRVPHYPLPHATAVYQTWDIGRVRFIMTDQRSEASPSGMVDSPSKSMLGATQKAWFKGLISGSPGMLLVWVCPRWFANANHVDSWNNFSFERAELADYIKVNAHGRVVVLEADQHTLAIDDGSHVDHATGGGEPLPCFRAAPLDQSPSALGISGSYSHGETNSRGQFGTMAVADSGGSAIGVTWTGYDSTGAALLSRTFSVAV